MGAHGADEIRKHVKVYWLIYLALLFLTGVTVGVSYIHLPIHEAVLLALAVATIKGSLVGLFFMHLNAEKKIIYGTISLTGIFFAFVLLIATFL